MKPWMLLLIVFIAFALMAAGCAAPRTETEQEDAQEYVDTVVTATQIIDKSGNLVDCIVYAPNTGVGSIDCNWNEGDE